MAAPIFRVLATAALLLTAGCSAEHRLVAAPSPSPSVSTQLVTVLEYAVAIERLDLPSLRRFTADEANLIFPDFGVHLDVAAKADRFPVNPPIVAAPGRELVFARLGTPPVAAVEGGHPVVWFEDHPHPLPVDRLAMGNVIVVSVPKGEDPTLELTDAGRGQSIHLLSGTVVDPIVGYYPKRTGSAEISCLLRHPNERVNNVTLGLWLSATLLPYTRENGWSPDGRLWLVVGATPYQNFGHDITLTLDAGRSVHLAGPAGAIPVTGQVVAGGVPFDTSKAGTISVTSDAPATGDVAVTVTYTPVGTLTVDGAATQWRYPCAGESATATLK